MKFRPHRGLLADSMDECVELATQRQFHEHIAKIFPNMKGKVSVEPYSARPDTRIGWEKTCIVMIGDHAMGFTDKLLNEIPAAPPAEREKP